MSRRSIPKALALAVVWVQASACYKYIPIQYDAVPAGQHVKVWVAPDVKNRLDSTGTMTLGDPVLKGMVTSKANGGLGLQIPIATRQEGFHSQPIFVNETLAQRDILTIELRKFDPTGTAALTGGTIGAAAVVIFTIMKAYGEGETPEQCGEECSDLMAPTLPRISHPGRRIPLFSIPTP